MEETPDFVSSNICKQFEHGYIIKNLFSQTCNEEENLFVFKIYGKAILYQILNESPLSIIVLIDCKEGVKEYHAITLINSYQIIILNYPLVIMKLGFAIR